MSFRNTIDPTVGKQRQNAGKSYQESVSIITTDNSVSPVTMFRKNAGKVYTPETSQQIIEVTKPQLMRVGGKQRGSGSEGAIAPSYNSYLDLAAISSNLQGFSGVCADSDYVYYSPNNNGSAINGWVTRVSQINWAVAGVTYFDLTGVNSGLKGFQKPLVTGGSLYLPPWHDGSAYHGKVVKINTSNFASGGVNWFDLSSINSNFKGFSRACTDGNYVYLSPYNNGSFHGNVVRIALNDFSSSGVSSVNLASVNSNLTGFFDCFTDSSHLYLIPYNNGSFHGYVARVSLSDFTTSGVSFINLGAINSDYVGFYGGFQDSSYIYLITYYNGLNTTGQLVRVSKSNFTSGGVSALNLKSINSNYQGFYGGSIKDNFAYLTPVASLGSLGDGGIVVKVNLTSFNGSGVTAINLRNVNDLLRGFDDSCVSGNYLYLCPFYTNPNRSGKAVRLVIPDFAVATNPVLF